MTIFTRITNLNFKHGVLVNAAADVTEFGLEIGFIVGYFNQKDEHKIMRSLGTIILGNVAGLPTIYGDSYSSNYDVSKFRREVESKVSGIQFWFGHLNAEADPLDELQYAIQICADYNGKLHSCMFWIENLVLDLYRFDEIVYRPSIFLDFEWANYINILLGRREVYMATRQMA